MVRPSRGALLGALLAAAWSWADVPVSLSPPSVTVREAALENGVVTVTLEVPSTPRGPKPVVISASPETRARLLDAGIMVARFEVHGKQPSPRTPAGAPRVVPGPTYGKWLLASPSPGIVGKDYFTLVAFNAENAVPRVVDWLVSQPDVDPTRLGIAGASTAGFVALQALAVERRLAAAVVLVSCGDYHCFLRDSILGMDGRPLALERAYDRWLHAREPTRNTDRITHAALLMVNGPKDPVIPWRCVQETARVFRQAYRRRGGAERFRFVTLDEQGHNLDAQATEEVMAWWYRWFVTPPRAP